MRAVELVSEFEDRDQEHLIRAIFNEWFQLDLDMAISHALSLPRDRQLLIVHELVTSQLNLPNSVERNIAQQLGAEIYYTTWVSARDDLVFMVDPKSHWYSLLAKTEEIEKPWIELGHTAESWIKMQGIEVIREICASMDNVQLRMRVTQDILQRSMKFDPYGILRIAESLENIDNEIAVHSVLSEWARFSPLDALEATSTFGTNGSRRIFQERVLSSWAHNDPQGLLDNLNEIPKGLQNWSQRKALDTLSRRDPKTAAKYLPRVHDIQTKVEVSRLIAKEWSSLDVHATLDWILSSRSLATDLRTLGTVLQKLAMSEPELALQKALEQPVSESSVGPETFVLASVSAMDTERAISMVSRCRENSRPLSNKFIAFYLLRKDDTSRALEFGAGLPETAQKDYFIYLFGQWRQSNHHSLIDGLERLDSEKVRFYAARVLDYENRRSGFLSDEAKRSVESILSDGSMSTVTDRQLGLASLPPHSFLGVQGR